MIFVYGNVLPTTVGSALDTELNSTQTFEDRPAQTSTPSTSEVFIPSRKRDLKAMQERAACSDQPTGSALPSLLPCKTTMRSHLQATLAVNPQGFYLDKLLTPQIKNITKQLKEQPDAVIRQRSEVLRHLGALSDKLDKTRSKWQDNLPKDSPPKGINFPFLHLILTSLDYDDKSLTGDISRGLPIAGVTPHANALKPKKTKQTLSINEWLTNIESRNRRVLGYLDEPKDSRLTVRCWAKSMGELAKNWITTPKPIADEVLRELPLTPRFCITEQHGLGPEKIRLINDCEISEINKTLELYETSAPDSLNVALSMARIHSLSWKQLTLQLVIVDFSHAYKHIGIDHRQNELSHIALLSPTGIPMYCKLNTQPFGSARAPANWARMTTLFPSCYYTCSYSGSRFTSMIAIR